MSIVRIVEFHAAAGKANELHQFLSAQVAEITAAQGCLSCEVLRHCDRADQLVVLERWETEEAHQAAAREIPPETMQKAMRLIVRPPKGAYYQA